MRTFFAFVGAGAGFSLGALIVNKIARLATKDDILVITESEQARMDYARQDVADTLETFPKKHSPKESF